MASVPSPPRAVLLDALGTLVGLEPPWPALVAALRERHGIEIGLDRAVAALRAEMSYYRANCIGARDAETLAALRRRCAEIVAAGLGPPVAGLAIDELTETLLSALRFRAYPDAQPALAALAERGIATVVVSNWDVSLHDVLAETGLAGYLAGALTSAELGTAKPAPEIFAAALALTGAEPAAALHVGDSYGEDVIGARAAGIAPVLLLRAPGELLAPAGEPPDAALREGVATIASLAELAQHAA